MKFFLLFTGGNKIPIWKTYSVDTLPKITEMFASHPSAPYLIAFSQIAQLQGCTLFLVGGCIRDALLNRPISDLDLLLSGNLEHFLKSVSTNPQLKIVLLDKEHQQYRIAVKKENRFFFDISPCHESQLEKKLIERDFSINALAIRLDDLLNGKEFFLDPQNGLLDLQEKKIRCRNEGILQADPLRILRAFRFAAMLNFCIEEKTRDYLIRTAPLLKKISPERIRDEFFKILEVQEAYPWIKKLDEAKILEILFPVVCEMKKTNQNKRFHEYNVWEHSLETLHYIEKILAQKKHLLANVPSKDNRRHQAWLKFAALFHDIGKPSTFAMDEMGEIHFYGHEEVGAAMMTKLGRELRLSTKEIQGLSLLVRHHLRPAQLARSQKFSPKAMDRLLRSVYPYARELFLLSLADTLAKGKPKESLVNFLEKQLEMLDKQVSIA
jgi:poly(A) polymerase